VYLHLRTLSIGRRLLSFFYTLAVLVVLVTLFYFYGATVARAQSDINPTPNFGSRQIGSSWTGTFSGNAGSQDPNFWATYSGSFSFTVGGDNKLSGSGSISKSYGWSGCGPPPYVATGYLAVNGYVDASNMVHFDFSVSQASNDVSITGCGTVFGATDGFPVQVTMQLADGQTSGSVNQLQGYPDFIQITLQQLSSSSSSSAVTVTSAPATTSAPLVVQPPPSGGDGTFYIFVIIVIVIFGAYVWYKQSENKQVQGQFHGHWEDNTGSYVPFRPPPPTSGPDPLGPYRWVTPEEEEERAEARKRGDEWFKQHPPKHRTPPQPPPPRPTVKFGRKSIGTFCTNCGANQSGKFCTKCGKKLKF
jgi:hypothetical protein